MSTVVSESNRITRELWTAEDFLDWLEPGVHADLIDGEKCTHSPVSLRHADFLNFVDSLLRQYIEALDLGRLYREVVAVRLSSRNVFLPDLAFIPKIRLTDLADTHIPFAPSLVVEALSPRTADRDTGPKFAAYEEHGVNEYWILDPQTLAHRFYQREGEFLVEFAENSAEIASSVIDGLVLQRDWLDPERFPPVDTCKPACSGVATQPSNWTNATA